MPQENDKSQVGKNSGNNKKQNDQVQREGNAPRPNGGRGLGQGGGRGRRDGTGGGKGRGGGGLGGRRN